MNIQEVVTNYWQQHGVVGVLAAWVVLSGVLNLLFRLKSPADWVVWADANPKLKMIVDLVRGWGVDPVAALEALQVYAQKKAEAEEAKAKQDAAEASLKAVLAAETKTQPKFEGDSK